MQAVFDHSWQLLTGEERRVMQRFSVFRGGCTRVAAEQISGATLKTLAGLVAKSMLRHDAANGRYEVHELLRQYAHEQLVAIGDREAASEAHCRYYAAFMQQRAPDVKGRRQLEALDEIEADWNNVRTAWGHGLAHQDWVIIGQMMETLHLFCDMRARYVDGEALFQQAVDRMAPTEASSHPLWGELLVRAAEVVQLPENHWAASMALLDRAAQETRIGDDPLYLWVRGRTMEIMREHIVCDMSSTDPVPLLKASLAGFCTCDNRYYMARVLRSLAYFYVSLSYQFGNEYTERFISYTQLDLDLTREIGDETGMAHALHYRGEVARHLYQLDEAKRYFREAATIWRKLGDWKSVAVANYWLGNIAVCDGDFDRAKSLLKEAAQLASEANYPIIHQWALDLLGAIACFEGDYRTGQQILAELPASELPQPGLWVTALGLGNFHLAREHLQTRLRWYQMHPVVPLDITHPPIDVHPIKVFPMAAMLLAHEGELEWAVELLARYASEREIPMGWFKCWALLDQVRDDLERQLGATAFDAAWQRGERLKVEAATARLLAYLGSEPATSQAQANQALDEPLTERELEVLHLIAEGFSDREIAETLILATGTIKGYGASIRQKLGAHSRTHAVTIARELGLL